MTAETVDAGDVNKHVDGVTDHVGGVIKLLDQVPETSFL